MPVWVSLLRGVNLGARNQVSMPRLREALESAGFADVRTYVQSGNVVARSRHRSRDRVASEVRALVREHFGVDAAVIVRTPAQLASVLDWNPFPTDAVARPATVQVIHLTERPDKDRLAALLAEDWAPDDVAARGEEVVIRYAATMHRSRLQHATVLRRLGADWVSTARPATGAAWRRWCSWHWSPGAERGPVHAGDRPVPPVTAATWQHREHAPCHAAP